MIVSYMHKMISLVKKDIVVNRSFTIIAFVMGLILVPIGVKKPEFMICAAIFIQLILTHLIYNMNQQSSGQKKENMLLNSLPLNRNKIVAGKYLYNGLIIVVNAVFLTLITWILYLFGFSGEISLLFQMILLITIGLIYFIVSLPISFASPKLGILFSFLIYLAILNLPSRLSKHMDAAKEILSGFIVNIVSATGAWIIALISVLILALMIFISLRISQVMYRRKEI